MPSPANREASATTLIRDRKTPKRSCQVVVLAAGEGTRMKSALPKVMHPVGGLPMLGHVLATAQKAGARRLAVVLGPGAETPRKLVASVEGAEPFEQTERLGTAHAVLAARAALAEPADDVLVLYGDTPLITPATLDRLRGALAMGADVAVLGIRPQDPAGYGRLIVEGGRLVAIREERDASAAERANGFCNAGVMAFRGPGMVALLDRIGNANAKGEYYLTDAIELANAGGLKAVAVEAEADEVAGVNTRAELAEAEAVFQRRRRREAMLGGATLVDPATVYFSHDTVVGQDVLIEPSVVLGPKVVLEDGATIRAFSHLEGARVAKGAVIGPFARLRPGADIGEKAKVGNFCEVKNAAVAAGAKINHLSYIGDATVGAHANIGAGTITCNYDGFRKYRTVIGADAFIGSNSALVAPVTIGEGAFVASGSVVIGDVEPGALAVARGRQVNKPGWVNQFKARFTGSRQSD